MIYYEDEFVKMEIDLQNKLYVETFKPATRNMSEAQWKSSRPLLIDIFSQGTVDKMLSFCSDLHFTLTPELQTWLAENVSVKIGHFIRKIAIILPTEFVIQLSVEQLMEEQETGKISTQYFDNETDARNWLMK